VEVVPSLPPAFGPLGLPKTLEEERDTDGQPLCEAGCYRCLLSYYNQPDHTLIDRKDKNASGLLLDILCRLTLASTEQGTQGRAPAQHDAELSRTAGSSLEQAWLAHVSDNGYRKPDRGQHTIAAVGTCVDFFYDDLHLAVFIDGPHHDTEGQKQKDANINRKLDELGYLVVRFPKETTAWSDIFKNNTDLFGPGKN
jgi:very-short-patch-repair endonuclease